MAKPHLTILTPSSNMTKQISEKRIEFSAIFNKKLEKAPTEIKIAFAEIFELFLEDPKSKILRNHDLKNKYAGMRSIDVTEDWRALYREEKERIIFFEIGTHSQLYKKN